MRRLEEIGGNEMRGAKWESLSTRAREILILAGEGFADKEIAKKLGLSAATVKSYWVRIRHRTGGTNRTEAVVAALRMEKGALEVGQIAGSANGNDGLWNALCEDFPGMILVMDLDGNVNFRNRECACVPDCREKACLLCPSPEPDPGARRALQVSPNGNGRFGFATAATLCGRCLSGWAIPLYADGHPTGTLFIELPEDRSAWVLNEAAFVV